MNEIAIFTLGVLAGFCLGLEWFIRMGDVRLTDHYHQLKRLHDGLKNRNPWK